MPFFYCPETPPAIRHTFLEETSLVARLIREMRIDTTIRILGTILLAGGQILLGDVKKLGKSTSLTPEAGFAKTVQPFLSTYCLGCHNQTTKTANLDLQQFTSVESVRANLKVWKKVAWRLQAGEMPPAKTPHPKPLAQKAVLKWVNAELANGDGAKK